MGMDIKSKLLYGAEYEDVFELEDIDEILDEGELEYASPYYDSGRDNWFVGVEIGNRHATEDDLVKAIARAKAEWDILTDCMPGTIRCCAHVY